MTCGESSFANGIEKVISAGLTAVTGTVANSQYVLVIRKGYERAARRGDSDRSVVLPALWGQVGYRNTDLLSWGHRKQGENLLSLLFRVAHPPRLPRS